jgi:Cdc6-like AAA superfamily ATPase
MYVTLGGAMNPFRTGQRVTGEFFTDRAEEVARIVRAMRDPSRLLVYGPRRVGKSSAIAMAAERVRQDGGLVVEADLSTASTVTDVTNRLLTSLHRAGRGPRPSLLDFLGSLRMRFDVDQASGTPSVALESRERASPPERQAGTLESVLDRIDALASDTDAPVSVVLDEFQEVVSLGPDRADWWLRSVMQRHEHVSYVCAGSRKALIDRMIGKEGPFFGGFERIWVGPVDPGHLSRWIDSRMEGAGVPALGCGRAVIAAVGPRLEDVMNLARQTYYIAAARGRYEPEDPGRALDEIVRADEAAFHALWDGLTALQQNVLRAVAAGEEALHAAATRGRYALGPSSSVTVAVRSLVDREIVVREARAVAFDNPFFRCWVRAMPLEDIGR